MSTPPQNTATLDPADLNPEEIQAELHAVLRSSSFERSEKLQKFLRFICEMTLRGDGGRINEYLIGSEVFLRGPEYSPSEDSVVRRQAHTLRQKLHEYYNGEGSNHPLRIELPVGRYVPVFRRLPAEPSPPPPEAPTAGAVPEMPAATVAAPVNQWSRRFWAGGATLVLMAAGYYAGTVRSVAPASPAGGGATEEIWGPWIASPRPAIICFSSPMTTVLKHFETVLPADTVPKRFRVQAAEEEVYRQAFHLPPGGAVYYSPAVNQTKVGEAMAAVQLTSMLTRLGTSVQSTQSRFLSWDDLRANDLILLGNNEANRWLDPLLIDAPFQLTPSAGRRQRAVVNRAPRPGEPSEYIINYAAEENGADQEYALISMLPGMTASRRLLLISGLNAQATQAATEYLASESSLSALLTRLRQESPNHKGPWHFQAVVKAEVRDKVPTRTWLVAVRVL
jgi:hypothetical protein